MHLGWCLLGDGDRALEYYRSICPSTQPDIETYRAEPYVYAQMIAGRDAATPGEAKNWGSYSVTRRFRGVTYEITISNPDGVSTGVRSLTVDGAPVDGNVVPLTASAEAVVVDVVLGGDRR